ncbi:MAG: prepilin-type N-terminal cleavage/methylation domain-containing protein [Verrucomicrobia bacterium]|nr:prepilin-type N-terminal cleavage/methylation domain-containing protein [Verrucomicrobiota bacterium]
MKTQLNTKNVLAKGFSLVEMLVVIAVIGIIAAIAIPSIGSINTSAQTATNKRNAQNIASVYATGNAAGATWPSSTETGAAAVIDQVSQGNTNTSVGSFSVGGLDAASKTGAAGYLSASGVYTP